jgi:hypothetical protein
MIGWAATRACYELYRACVEGKKARVLGVRSAVWLFQMSDEQPSPQPSPARERGRTPRPFVLLTQSRFFTLNPSGSPAERPSAALRLACLE